MTAARAIDSDYLFAQAAICQRINELHPELDARPVDEMASATEQHVASPRVFVAWAGEQVADHAGHATRTAITHRYTVLLVLRHAQQGDQGKRNGLAGPLLSKLHQALAGHQPEGAHRPFKRVTGAAPSYNQAVGIYPLSFELQITL